MKIRRLIAAVLIPIFTVWSVWFPSQVYANPLILVGARVASVAIKNPQLVSAELSGMVTTIGALIMAVAVTRVDTAGTTRKDEIQITNTARQPSTIEAAAGFTAGFPHLAPAGTASSSLIYWSSTWATLKFNSATAACNQVCTGNPFFSGCTLTTSTLCRSQNSGTYYYDAINSSTACPAGYSGTPCLLTAPDSVARPLDGYCPIVRISNSYGVDTTDPDCAVPGATPQIAADGTVEITGADGVKVSYSVPSAGKHQIKLSTPDPVKNETKVRIVFLNDGATPADPLVVSGGQDSVVQGTGDGVTTTAAPTPTDMAPTVAAINATTAAVQAQTAQEKAWNDGEAARDAEKIGTPSAAEPIATRSYDLSSFNFNTYAFAGNSACPAPLVGHLSTGNISFSYQPLCDFLGWFRIGILSVALFSASLILLGQRSSDNS